MNKNIDKNVKLSQLIYHKHLFSINGNGILGWVVFVVTSIKQPLPFALTHIRLLIKQHQNNLQHSLTIRLNAR